MSKNRWLNPIDGDFADTADWSKGAVPGAGDTAILAGKKTAYTVTSSADQTVASVQTGKAATLSLTGGTFTATNGTGKNGVNAGTIEIGNATLAIGGTFDNSGAVIETGLSFFRLNADTKLTGGGEIMLDGSFLFGAASGITLTNVDNTIAGAGAIGTAQGMSLANRAAGVIDATGSLTLEMGGGTVTNAGLLEATGGGDLAIFNSAVDGSGGGVISAKDGSTVILDGADIIGGTLKSSGTGFIETGGTIPSVIDGRDSAVTNAGLLEVTDQTTLTLEGVITNKGDIFLDSAKYGTTLLIGADTALTGGGQVALDDSQINVITGASAATVLDNVDNTITGAGQFGFGALTLKNEAAGVIDATGTSNGLVLAPAGTIENDGLIEATGQAGLSIYRTIDQSAGGVILADGAAVNLAADIIGGTLRARNGGSVQTIYKGQTTVIDGRASAVAVVGPFRITFGAKVTMEGAISNAGTIALSGNPSLGHSTLVVGADTTLSGGGQITLTDTVGPSNFISGATASTRLVNVDNTISGAGEIGNNVLTLVNQAKGVIDATGTNVLSIDTAGMTLTNAGLIEATGKGGMNLDPGAFKNTGTIKVDGSLIEVNAAVTGSGAGVINDGDLYFNQAFHEDVTFTGASGVLGLGQSQTYDGTIAGFSASGGTALVLGDIGFVSTGEATFSGTKTSGVLTVGDGTHIAHITLIGDFRHTAFVTSNTGAGVAVQASGGAPVAPPHALAAAMAGLGGASAAPIACHARAETWRPSLCAPRPAFA